jgi:hypothetical protein
MSAPIATVEDSVDRKRHRGGGEGMVVVSSGVVLHQNLFHDGGMWHRGGGEATGDGATAAYVAFKHRGRTVSIGPFNPMQKHEQKMLQEETNDRIRE